MKILVTGGTVFASRFTAEYFAEKGHAVYVLNRGTRPQPEGAVPIIGDRHDLGGTLKGYDFDAVLDITGYTGSDVSELADALGNIRRYIFVSSSAVYPETLPRPFREDQPCGANSIWGDYGASKIAAERYLLENVPQAYIIRPPYLYGRMNNLYREAFLFDCAEKDMPFYAPKDGKMRLQFFDIEDMCRFMEILLEKEPSRRVFNVGNPETVDINRWARLCYGVLGKEPEIKYVDGGVPQREYFPFYDYDYALDVSAMSELTDSVKPLTDGLEESYEWYARNRELVRKKPFFEYIGKMTGG